MKIATIITGRNCEQYAAECIESILSQKHKPHEVFVWDDASEDGTADILAGYDVTVQRPATRSGALRGRYEFVHTTTADVVCFVGLDDSLPFTSLATINRHYEANPRLCMTWGSWRSATRAKFSGGQYSDNVWRHRSFRREIWKATAMNTFKTDMIRQVPKDKLMIGNDWFTNCTDLAYSFPCLEMLDKGQTACVEEVVYNYREDHPKNTLNTYGMFDKEQVKIVLRGMKPMETRYEALPSHAL